MRTFSLVLAASLLGAMAAPAMAQVKPAAPAKPGAMITTAPAAGDSSVAAGDEAFRPTGFMGIERAQVLAEGNTVMGFGGLNANYGFGSNMELGGSANLTLGTGGLNLTPAAQVKQIFSASKAMSMAWGASLGLGLNASSPMPATPFTLGAKAYVPISFWAMGPGDLHVMPYLGMNLTPWAFNLGAMVGYEFPIMDRWTLEIVDDIGIAGAFSNTIRVGSRVALTPNLTADVGGVTLTTAGAGTSVTINILGISGSLGGKLPYLRGLFGV